MRMPASSSTSVPGAIRSFVGHSGLISSADISHDCNWLLTASTDNTIRLWDAGKAVGCMIWLIL